MNYWVQMALSILFEVLKTLNESTDKEKHKPALVKLRDKINEVYEED